MAACKIVWADPSLRYTACCSDVRQPTNKHMPRGEENWSSPTLRQRARLWAIFSSSLQELACCWDVKQPTNKQTIPPGVTAAVYFYLDVSAPCVPGSLSCRVRNRLVGLVVKASALRAKIWGSNSACRIPGFFWVESYQWLKNWHSSGYPARCLELLSQSWDWSSAHHRKVKHCES